MIEALRADSRIAMTESPDPQLQLKKRARRRLVGAVAFAGLAAVILPMVMDQEPQRQVQDVPIRIPGQDQLPFKPKEMAAKAAPPLAVAAVAAAAGEQQDTKSDGDLARKGTAPAPAASPATKIAEKAVDKASDRKAAKPAEKAPEKTAEKKAPKAPEKLPEKSVDKKAPKAAEKMPEKPADNKTVKPAEKAVDKAVEKKIEKPADKMPEKSPVKKVDQPAEKPAEGGSDDGGKPAAEDALPAAGPAAVAPASKRPEAAPARSGGQHVILIGAFSNPENVKQLQGKIGGVGVNTYTEPLDSADGKKTRVRAGPFPSREAAEKALEKLKKIGVNGVVAGRQ